MSEGRKTQIVLLDDRRLEILIQPKLYAGELLEMVASHFQLKEKDYFGLCFKDDTGHQHWLQLDRKVLEHEFPRDARPLILFFAVRFFIESIAYLRDNATIELFYLQAKSAVFRGLIDCDSETAFELAGHVLQASFGDYSDETSAKKTLKKLPVLPTATLQEHPSLSYCEERVLEHYRKLAGQTRGSAIVNYMTIIESLPTYGIHYYEVKDKAGIPWWLGLSYKGISQYDFNDKKAPRRVFAWKQLENLYFRDKKFSIEVHDPKRVSVSRRTFGPGNVNVHAWFAATPQLTKCIWSMAVSQHQFYLDRKQSKSSLPAVRSMSEIAADLCQSSSSLQSSATSGSLSRSNSQHSLSQSLSTANSKTELTSEELEASRSAQRDMHAALKARREVLEEALRKRTEELRALCIKEGELTGNLPPETPQKNGEPTPTIRRRVGTGFSLSPQVLNRDKKTEEEDMISKLELDYELQNKITEAALKLAKDPTVAKSVRKKRKTSYHKSHQKLKDLEKKLNDFRRHQGKTPVKHHYSSVEDLSEDSREFLDSESEFISPVGSPAVQHRVPQYQIKPRYPAPPKHHGQVKIIASPKGPASHHYQQQQQQQQQQQPLPGGGGSGGGSPAHRGNTPSPRMQHRHQANHGHGGQGYVPNAVYTTQYRKHMYPYKQPPHQNDYENAPAHNMYNLNTHRTSRYDSSDDILQSPDSQGEMYDTFPPGGAGGTQPRLAKHGSLEYRQAPCPDPPYSYGSLERNSHRVSQLAPDDLSDIVPSKFGSKRESHSDARDSHYPPPEPYVGGGDGQYGENEDFPPPPREAYRPYDDGGDHMEYGIPSTGQRNDSIPYIDSSHSSLTSSAGSAPPYPYTGRFEGGQPPPAPPQGYSPVTNQSSNTPSPVSVTKYQNYVEVSKPFEMADVYKYSERRRRARVSDQGPGSAGPSSPSSPYLPRSRPTSPPGQDSRLPHVQSSPAFPGARYPYQPQQPQQPHHTAYSVPPHQASRQQAYPPPNTGDNHTPHRSFNDSSSRAEMSFGSFDGGDVGDAFADEMLAWYEDHPQHMEQHYSEHQQNHRHLQHPQQHITPNRTAGGMGRSASHGYQTPHGARPVSGHRSNSKSSTLV